MAKTRRLEVFDGVTVTVVLKSWGYSIIIKIKEGAYLWHDRKSENCAIKFIVPYHKRIAQKSYKIKVNNQSYTHTKLGSPFKRNFDLPYGGICLLYLAPSFFLTDELLKQCKGIPKDVGDTGSHQLLFAPVTKKAPKNNRTLEYDLRPYI